MRAEFEARQFAFVDVPDFAPPGWRRRDLPGGWRLVHHPDTPIETLSADPAAPALRIGQAYAVDAAGGAGRFVTLRWPDLTPDAAALLGLHHGAHAGRRVVASSPALAAFALHGAARAPDLGLTLDHRSHLNYVPMPGAPYAGLRKLLHDQALDLAAFAVRHRPSPILRLGSHDAALVALAGGLVRFAEELKRRTLGKVYLPLTAGLDSRTIAAAFAAVGLDFETVTLDFCGKPSTDVSVARAIARRLGVRHRTLRLDRPDPARAARYAAHVAGAALDWDHTHVFPGGGYRYLAAGDVMVVGACFEVGRQTAGEGVFRDLCFETATGAEVWRRRTGTQAPPVAAALLDEWIAWRRAHPLDMDFAAAFYLDQRLGGWRAALEHGYDLLPGVSVCPANDARIYSALITPSPADQRAGLLQREAIALLAPELLEFPINPAPLRHRVGRWRRDLVQALAAPFAWTAARPKPATGD
jgi:hypothetical protein